MEQQVIITTDSAISIKPVLEAAIRNEQKLLAHGIRRTKERLAAWEKQSNMSSADFERDFLAGRLSESLDFIEWLGEIRTLRLLESNYHALESVQVK